MKREVELRRRLRSLEGLGEMVGALKSLSAHHFRELRKSVRPAREYREGIEEILKVSGASLPGGTGPAGLLVIGGELGLCGSYNAEVVQSGVRARQALGEGPTFCIGRRAAALLRRSAIDVQFPYGAPTSLHGIASLLLRLMEDVLEVHVARRMGSFDVVASRFDGIGVTHPVRVRLLPVAVEPSHAAPCPRYVSRETLASSVTREFLYITLYDLVLDALTCEHGARLLATEAAERWLERRADQVRSSLAATRRETSTQETLEIVAGSRARPSAG
jgi:F-type H+-transporting ATPase subunit gamma